MCETKLLWSKVIILTSNRKSHTRFRFVPKSATFDDRERPLGTLLHTTCIFETHHENLNEDRPLLSPAKM